MSTLISMIRGINVGGNRPIKMERLKELYRALGFADPRSYLQSGNLVCEVAASKARGHGEAVERRILRDCGFEVSVAVRSSKEMSAALAGNPLARRASVDPKFLHATFLIRPGDGASLGGVSLPLGAGEDAVLVGDIVYLYCPNGYGNTKINNTFFERKLGLRATTRNWQTVTALEKMAREGAAAK
jgi:uncharacterized protein (DUF1697 family)